MYISIYPSFIVEPPLSDTPEYHIAAYTPNYPIWSHYIYPFDIATLLVKSPYMYVRMYVM